MILLTGGLGYIGSHTCVELLKRGERIVIMDNLSNSREEAMDNIKSISQASNIITQFVEFGNK